MGVPLKAYAERHGKVRWGDKRPAYALHVAEILRLFPDAQFVHLVRRTGLRGLAARACPADQVGCKEQRISAEPSGVWCVQLQGGGGRRRDGGVGNRRQRRRCACQGPRRRHDPPDRP
nr:sulfotransferase [Streptomyces cupreus]